MNILSLHCFQLSICQRGFAQCPTVFGIGVVVDMLVKTYGRWE